VGYVLFSAIKYVAVPLLGMCFCPADAVCLLDSCIGKGTL